MRRPCLSRGRQEGRRGDTRRSRGRMGRVEGLLPSIQSVDHLGGSSTDGSSGTDGSAQGGLDLGPAGRWWQRGCSAHVRLWWWRTGGKRRWVVLFPFSKLCELPAFPCSVCAMVCCCPPWCGCINMTAPAFSWWRRLLWELIGWAAQIRVKLLQRPCRCRRQWRLRMSPPSLGVPSRSLLQPHSLCLETPGENLRSGIAGSDDGVGFHHSFLGDVI